MTKAGRIKRFRRNFTRYDRYLVIKRFLRYVEIKDEDECWEWKGSRTERGYGNFGWPEKNIQRANIAAYVLFVGSIPEKHGKQLFVCHSCDNPPCVNPNHLWLGTAKQNMHDRDKKNRHMHGEDHNNAKLTEHDVKKIRKYHSIQRYTAEQLAKKFDISVSTIHRVITKKYWKHVK